MAGSATVTYTLLRGSGRLVKISNIWALYTLTGISADELVEVRATATADDAGTTRTATSTATFTNRAVIQPPRPVINTLPQTIGYGQPLQLSATDSDPGGTIVSRGWTASGGLGFQNANTRNARWLGARPDASGGATADYVLTYTVTDDDGQSASASFVVTVQAVQPLEAAPSAGAPTARANLGGPLGLGARPSAGDPEDAANLGGPLGLGARAAAGAPTGRAAILAPLAARGRGGAPTAELTFGLSARPTAGAPTARLSITGRTRLDARPAAGAPTGRANLGGPITLSARAERGSADVSDAGFVQATLGAAGGRPAHGAGAVPGHAHAVRAALGRRGGSVAAVHAAVRGVPERRPAHGAGSPGRTDHVLRPGVGGPADRDPLASRPAVAGAGYAVWGRGAGRVGRAIPAVEPAGYRVLPSRNCRNRIVRCRVGRCRTTRA